MLQTRSDRLQLLIHLLHVKSLFLCLLFLFKRQLRNISHHPNLLSTSKVVTESNKLEKSAPISQYPLQSTMDYGGTKQANQMNPLFNYESFLLLRLMRQLIQLRQLKQILVRWGSTWRVTFKCCCLLHRRWGKRLSLHGGWTWYREDANQFQWASKYYHKDMVSHKPFCLRNFFVCRRISLLAFVMVNCRAKGENSVSLSLHSPRYSLSASPRIVRSTNALALRRWVLKRPLMEVTNPSPAPSVGRLGQAIGNSDFPAWFVSLSLKLRSVSGTAAGKLGSFWVCPLSLNFLPYTKTEYKKLNMKRGQTGSREKTSNHTVP